MIGNARLALALTMAVASVTAGCASGGHRQQVEVVTFAYAPRESVRDTRSSVGQLDPASAPHDICVRLTNQVSSGLARAGYEPKVVSHPTPSTNNMVVTGTVIEVDSVDGALVAAMGNAQLYGTLIISQGETEVFRRTYSSTSTVILPQPIAMLFIANPNVGTRAAALGKMADEMIKDATWALRYERFPTGT
jgi:hypothetical protein